MFPNGISNCITKKCNRRKKYKNEMRILIICKALEHSFTGGIQTHVSSLSKELITQGHEVTLLTACNKKPSDLQNDNSSIKLVHLRYLPKQLAFGLSKYLGELSFNLMVKRYVKKYQDQYDIIHVQGRSGSMLSNTKIKKPIVTTVHRIMEIEKAWNKCEYSNSLDRYLHIRWCNSFENRILNNSNAIIAVSNNTKKELWKHCQIDTHINIIPNGVEIPFEPAEGIRKNLLFVGRLTEVKGLSTLIEAFKFVNKSIKLNIVGDGPYRDKLTALIKNSKFENRIKLLGQKDREDVYKLMSISQALVLPSFHESQGIVLLEANAHQLPVIATNNSGITEFVINGLNGLLFQNAKASDLASKINALFDNPDLASKMGKNGKRKMEDLFNWKTITNSTIDVYKSVA